MFEYVFNIETVKWKTPYTIIFTGNCTQCDGKFTLEYSGADLINVSNACIPDEWLKSLKEALNNDYKYGPFDKKEIRALLKKYHRYGF